MRRRRSGATGLLLVLAVGALGACGDDGAPVAEPRRTAASTRPTPPLPSTDPTDRLGAVRVTGTVEATAPGCATVRSADGVRWALTGSALPDLAAGQRITATGRGTPEALTPCAGTPLRVTAVAPR